MAGILPRISRRHAERQVVEKPQKDIYEVIRELGKYPPDAFQFVQEGLSHAVTEVHGEMTDEQQEIHKFIFEHDLNLETLEMLQLKGQLPDDIEELLAGAGSIESLNRHVSGQHLCWGLRNYALKKFGALASTVLRHWCIKRTRDFGEIVFALVDNDYLQQQSQDCIEDFDDIFQFDEAFDRSFKIDLREQVH